MQRRAKAIRPMARTPNTTPRAMPRVRSLGWPELASGLSGLSVGSASFGMLEPVVTGRLTS
jgi:hypothetical protein